jgi:hypothetical protein
MRGVERQDVERIARAALRELGASGPEQAEVTEDDRPGHWRIAFDGSHGRAHLRIKGGPGTTPQWIREQIFQQYLAQT